MAARDCAAVGDRATRAPRPAGSSPSAGSVSVAEPASLDLGWTERDTFTVQGGAPKAAIEAGPPPTGGAVVDGRGSDSDPTLVELDLEPLRERIRTHMAASGLRSTEQRRQIIETFLQTREHITIDQLLALVRSEEPRVGYATVYRTMKMLTEAKVAHERRFGDGFTRYELAVEGTHHDHLICLDCGRIIEFSEPRIEALQDVIAAERGFAVRYHKHELYCSCLDESCPHRPPAR